MCPKYWHKTNDCLIDEGYRCIGIDQRGFGSSDRPVCGYDYDTLSDDVKAVVDTLGFNKFGDMFFYKKVSKPFMEWFFQLGLQAAGWSTAKSAQTWLGEESLFDDMKKIKVETLIIHKQHQYLNNFNNYL